MTFLDYRLKDYMQKKESNKLVLNATQQKLQNSLQTVSKSHKPPPLTSFNLNSPIFINTPFYFLPFYIQI